jgi:hypothetical protein
MLRLRLSTLATSGRAPRYAQRFFGSPGNSGPAAALAKLPASQHDSLTVDWSYDHRYGESSLQTPWGWQHQQELPYRDQDAFVTRLSMNKRLDDRLFLPSVSSIDQHEPNLAAHASLKRRYASSGGTSDDDASPSPEDAPPPSTSTDTNSGPSNGTNSPVDELTSDLRPSQVVKELDRHIVGQQDAKRAVAIALRNRWRRKQLSPELKKEVTPRNVVSFLLGFCVLTLLCSH